MVHLTSHIPPDTISLFVSNILTMENEDSSLHSTLPFYADGYPGIMFQETQNGMLILPQNKWMPDLFLYGQTIEPIQIKMDGTFRLIIFQLFPFVIQSFFGVDPESLNDDCYNLVNFNHPDVPGTIAQLQGTHHLVERKNIMSSFLLAVFEQKREGLDLGVKNALSTIIEHKGLLPIHALTKSLHLTERTLERRFKSEVGVTPKQFSKIIQFQHSLKDLQRSDYDTLSDIVFNNGFADQSHFTRVFKSFTGTTPSRFPA